MTLRRRTGTTQLDASQLDASAEDFVASAVAGVRSARSIALAIGAGRLVMGGVFLAYPAVSTRMLGLDSATAARVGWLARMAAVRDAALGAGTLATTAARRGQTAWLLAGALTDAGDAGVIALAARSGRLSPGRAYLVAGGALATALAALGSAAGMVRGRR